MKKYIFRLSFIVLISIIGLNASAHDIEVKNADGVTIYYNWVNDKTELAVSYRGTSFSEYKNEYSGVIVIPESVLYKGQTYRVTSIGDSAFRKCSMTSVTIPNSVTTIGSYAFVDCNSLTNMVVESGNPKYDSRNNCNAIIETSSNTLMAGCKNTIIPNNVTSIGEGAFSGCSGLTSITIPNSVTSIGGSAFCGCSGLTSITIPNSVTSIESAAFGYCSGLTSITIPNSVTSIGAWTFAYCSGLTSVIIGNGMTYIGMYAFQYCSGLTSVTIPNSVTSISAGAFSGCSALNSVTISNSVKYIATGVFSGCSKLTSVHISDLEAWCKIWFGDNWANPLYYAHHLYLGDKEITDLVIPNSVTDIREYAFSGCSGLTSVSIPNSVTSIGAGAFSDCSSLTSVSIPNSVTSIGAGAFSYCSSLTSVTIPNSVTTIGSYAFYECSSLTSVTIGNSVSNIGKNAFLYCSMTSVHISDLEAWCKILFNNYGANPLSHHLYLGDEEIKDLVIPNSVTTIGDFAFYGCSGLTSVTIPNSVTSIGESSFERCYSLTSVTIPNSVTSIGSYAFFGCSNITSVTSLNSTPPTINPNTFNDYSATLQVPTGSKTAYQNAEYWKNFMNIVEIDITGIQSVTLDKDTNAPIYDLNGRKLKEARKGINIIGGKKVVVK